MLFSYSKFKIEIYFIYIYILYKYDIYDIYQKAIEDGRIKQHQYYIVWND